MSKKGFEKVTNEEFSLPHCQLVFEHLAKFHALSFYMHNELNIDLSMFDNFTGKEIIGNIPIVSTTYQIFMEVAKNWDGGSEFVEKMKKFQPYYIEAIKKLTEIDPVENKFLVISHGDCHKHNYLFRKNMEECSIIDHQMVSWIGPGYDLIGALNTFCEPKDNFVNREFLLKCYHREFKRCLKTMNFSHKIPTLFDVHMEVLKNGLTDLLFWTVYVPLGSMDNSPENTKSFLERYKDALNTPRQKELSKFFTTFINRGYFDCEEDET
ncbi:uncharacterized protein LOC129797271 [Lutzomyia longipalpis]|uniref:uncharacterized protein LOC129797271 n=1 Tax=Lutzomyia longipalpis TaxID=7200 RepID=UPI002483843D|nr:uncharacterized protein LOC129797271 [Lutzomyia longipalpis]